MKLNTNFLFIGAVCISLTGCVTFFGKSKQKLSLTTTNSKSTVSINNEVIGTGTDVESIIKRDGTAKQIKVETPDCKTTYYAVIPYTTNKLYLLSCLFFYYPGAFDIANPKSNIYPNTLNIPSGAKKAIRQKDQKYIDIDEIKFSIKEKKFKTINLKYDSYLQKRELDTNNVSPIKSYTNSKDIVIDNTIFGNQLSKILKKNGYIDTVNQIFKDEANSLELRANIKSLTMYHIYNLSGVQSIGGCMVGASFGVSYSSFVKFQSDISWDVLNSYGELLKTVSIRSESGEFVYNSSEKVEKLYDDVLGDMIENSLDQVLSNKDIAAFTKISDKAEAKLALTSLTKPTSIVTKSEDVQTATVIVKTEKGHGSGFAITNDGYIITNYHVIASEDAAKPREAIIILGDGTKLKSTVVKFNKDRDVALLKVDSKFEKCFAIPTAKEFQALEEVFAMGAPKSVELGQSASKGIISSERNVNNVSLIQTNISINGGNSGGPMFNKDGKLYGVVTAKLFGLGVEGIAFAIPAYKLKDYLNIDFK